MRLPGFVLAFYLLFLAAIPCCALDNCPGEALTKSSGHKGGDGDCGNCSPFFNCEGCATATVVYEPFNFQLTPVRQSPVYVSYLESSLQQVKIDFWQPPKIG
ncbi:MAG: DUF6660 family protein [Chitinophagaceae bacterium]